MRHVTLPHESHGYVARESVLHVVAEMLRWCDVHLGGGGATEVRVSPGTRHTSGRVLLR